MSMKTWLYYMAAMTSGSFITALVACFGNTATPQEWRKRAVLLLLFSAFELMAAIEIGRRGK